MNNLKFDRLIYSEILNILAKNPLDIVTILERGEIIQPLSQVVAGYHTNNITCKQLIHYTLVYIITDVNFLNAFRGLMPPSFICEFPELYNEEISNPLLLSKKMSSSIANYKDIKFIVRELLLALSANYPEITDEISVCDLD